MIDNVQSMTPSAEQGCRLTALMESGGVAEVDLTDKSQQPNFTRRRRLNVRPSDSPENVNFFAGDYRYNKKRKPENHTVMRGFITDDQVELGTSSSEVKKVRENLVTCGSHGSISLIGQRREMEDAVSVKPGFLVKGSRKYDYYGVYDGHGGSRVAHLCHEFLHCLVIQQVLEEEDGDDERINWEKVMCDSFSKMDEKVSKEGTETATMGSTAVVAVVGEEELIVANCGDSRAVLSRAGVALPLSVDHKPDRPDELDRIENSGGRVINWNGQRILGVLATSRSIGTSKTELIALADLSLILIFCRGFHGNGYDNSGSLFHLMENPTPPKNLVSSDMYLKPYVIPDPEVIVSKRSDADEFLILASDGLWDVIPNDVACHVTRRCLNGEMIRRYDQQSKSLKTNEQSSEVVKENLAARAASFLAELAIGRGSKDNISIVVIDLNRSVSSSK